MAAESPLEAVLDDGRARHRTWLPIWAECMAFVQNRQFVWRNRNGTISQLPTTPDTKAESWRSRLVRNMLFPIVNAEVSAGTSRTPGYQVIPATNDSEAEGAANLSSKVLIYLYDELSLRRKIVNCYRYAVVCGEGFMRPYWNNQVGKPVPGNDDDDEALFEGEACVEVLGPDQVYWRKGSTFDESPFHAIDQAMTLQQISELPKLKVNPKELKTDTNSHGSFVTGQLSKKAARADSVLVTEYLEKPTKKSPLGRRVYVANGREITEPEAYPIIREAGDGYQPCLLKLSYVETPDRDRDMGLVEHLLDAQRTVNDCINKQIEWKNFGLNYQTISGPQGFVDPRTNEPGANFRYKGDPREVQVMQPATVPPELETMRLAAIQDMQQIASQNQPPPGVESGRAITALLERDQSVRAHILANLADFHSRLGQCLLWLYQRHASEKRLIQIGGPEDADYLEFTGVQLKGRVRVLPGSLERLTREAQEQKIQNIAAMFPGAFSPEEIISAMEGGTAETLIRRYERDVERAQRVILKIKQGPDQLFNAWAPRLATTDVLSDPESPFMKALVFEQTWHGETGAEPIRSDGRVPGWMPREFDRLSIHKAKFEEFFLGIDYEQAPAEMQEAAHLYYAGLMDLEAKEAQRAAMLQNAQAEQLGMQNAAKPQPVKPLASQPAINGGGPPA